MKDPVTDRQQIRDSVPQGGYLARISDDFHSPAWRACGGGTPVVTLPAHRNRHDDTKAVITGIIRLAPSLAAEALPEIRGRWDSGDQHAGEADPEMIDESSRVEANTPPTAEFQRRSRFVDAEGAGQSCGAAALPTRWRFRPPLASPTERAPGAGRSGPWRRKWCSVVSPDVLSRHASTAPARLSRARDAQAPPRKWSVCCSSGSLPREAEGSVMMIRCGSSTATRLSSDAAFSWLLDGNMSRLFTTEMPRPRQLSAPPPHHRQHAQRRRPAAVVLPAASELGEVRRRDSGHGGRRIDRCRRQPAAAQR